MKKLTIVFISAFMLMIALPLALINLKPDQISEAENRKLAPKAKFHTEDGSWNQHFTSDFESWVNDNIGFRSQMVLNNARMQYYLFGKIPSNSEMVIGPNGELNYIGESVMLNYQHANVMSEEDLATVVNSYQIVDDYLTSKGIQFYYVQNWDKQSIYPEEFPTGVNQFGEYSITEQAVNALEERTTVHVVSMKDAMLEGKEHCRTYNRWADVTHWSHEGAILGYRYLMDVLNENNDNQFRVLTDDDYTIDLVDHGSTLMGGIHQEDVEPVYTISNPTAVLTNDKLTKYADVSHKEMYYTNETVDNDMRVLFLVDSYFEMFIMDDLAESFHETIGLYAMSAGNLPAIVEEYQPDIVIYEKAEREPAYMTDMVNAAQNILK